VRLWSSVYSVSFWKVLIFKKIQNNWNSNIISIVTNFKTKCITMLWHNLPDAETRNKTKNFLSRNFSHDFRLVFQANLITNSRNLIIFTIISSCFFNQKTTRVWFNIWLQILGLEASEPTDPRSSWTGPKISLADQVHLAEAAVVVAHELSMFVWSGLRAQRRHELTSNCWAA
jgi:hypothetical protein